ncbi:MAG: hypothetical protein RR450_07605 [Oscillospiraceae bacterium]
MKHETGESQKLVGELKLYGLFRTFRVVEWLDMQNILPGISRKTALRYQRELTEAGLIAVRFSRRENAYVHCAPPRATLPRGNTMARRHLIRLNRLCRAAFVVAEIYQNDVPPDDEGAANRRACHQWYQAEFPEICARTRQRDLKLLTYLCSDRERALFDCGDYLMFSDIDGLYGAPAAVL